MFPQNGDLKKLLKSSRKKVPQSARLSAGGGVQKLKGQCPNAPRVNLRGASLTITMRYGLKKSVNRKIYHNVHLTLHFSWVALFQMKNIWRECLISFTFIIYLGSKWLHKNRSQYKKGRSRTSHFFQPLFDVAFSDVANFTTYFKLLILRTMDNFKIGDELNVQLISNILNGSGNLLQISNYF